jgi:hypothetical protein
MLNPSAMCRNGKGERGHPCLSHLEDQNVGEGTPFIRIVKEGVSMHPII